MCLYNHGPDFHSDCGRITFHISMYCSESELAELVRTVHHISFDTHVCVDYKLWMPDI